LRTITRAGLIAAGTAVALAPVMTPAFATNTTPKLHTFNCESQGAIYGPCDPTQPGSIGWVKGPDASGDNDGFSLAITTDANQPDSVSYAGANIVNSAIQGIELSHVDALSFETQGFQGGGAPRISLTLSGGAIDGGTAYLDPQYCESRPDSNGWQLADFRQPQWNTTDACTIYTTFGTFQSGPWQDGEGPQIDGTYTAFDWMNWAASNGAQNEPTVSQVTLVQDAGPGTSYVDDLQLGDGDVGQPVTGTVITTEFTAPPGQKKREAVDRRRVPRAAARRPGGGTRAIMALARSMPGLSPIH